MAFDKYDGDMILEEAEKNAKHIQELLNDLGALAPDHLNDYVDMVKGKLALRIFYQDYLYELHGTFIEAPPVVYEYDEYEAFMKELLAN